ncbi:MAG: GAF domain-containing protein [Synergistaceae bacterium]|jgi:GAF domain-containing protein|nr:GAF domain-containing protein [Synergistaceae bacterium]
MDETGEEIRAGDFFEEYRRLTDDPELTARLRSFIGSLSHGLDDLIADLLTELRSVTSSDGASIYVADGDVLRFIHAQNEALETSGRMLSASGESIYLGRTLGIDENSICGYVAATKKPLMVKDVRRIAPDAPFRFNDEYDRASGYRTGSVLTSPIPDDAGRTAGVLQLINHRNDDGETAPFEDWMLGYVLLLTEHFFPMIVRSFDRYREAEGDPRSSDLYSSLRSQLKMPVLNRRLPWLAEGGISWTDRDRTRESGISKRLLSFARYVNRFEDIGTVIETMLTEARDATHADGGTFYLVTENGLRFAYVQNDTLFTDNSRKNHYIDMELPMDDTSISGYVALERKPLNIRDVENLPKGLPCSFNRSFDDASGYRTTSVLTVPISGAMGAVIAVLQLVNCMSGRKVKPFEDADVRYADLLAGQTMPCLTRSIMTRRLLDSMLRMSNLHDPLETALHVHRVGAFAAEIYHKWAQNRNMDPEETKIEMDSLRLAAMLHDIGKVSVPDAILKKAGKLTDEEYEIMKTHCSRGASIYSAAESRLERMAYDITLHHHQRWDGQGYTGDPSVPSLAGEAIPLHARITSAADVLDALAFSRSYKTAWSFDDALAELIKSAGAHFDPEVIAAATGAADVLKAIVERYRQ